MAINPRDILGLTEQNVRAMYHKELAQADAHQLHNALGSAVMALIAPDWMQTKNRRAEGRQAAYLSAEYLTGRLVYNNLLCLGLLRETEVLFKERGIDLAAMEDVEDDAFGNGGLGRLAACFLDSAATLDVPLTGYGLRYRYGLFYQYFENGLQKEAPDDWSRLGDPWSVRRDDLKVIVPIEGMPVSAVPYDMPVIGYKNGVIGTLRLWQTESLNEVDFATFNAQRYQQAAKDKNGAEDIVKFLYPNDTRPAGKLLRLKQQYVLSSATLQDMLRAYRGRYGRDYSHFAECWAVQLNDTHPTLAIPELIRLLMLDHVTFDQALAIAKATFAYTNHTVMQEALEKWDLKLLRRLSPEIAEILLKIDAAMRAELGGRMTEGMGIRQGSLIHMANLAMYGGHAVNGVARIHTEILRNDVLKDWYAVFPEHFSNKTNGITQRRWLGLCNPELTALMNEAAGADVLLEPEKMKALAARADDEKTLCRMLEIKQACKRELARVIKAREGVDIPESFIFDVQVKRLHEYKRQLMNAFSVIAIYEGLKDGSIRDFTPTAFIFGAKAAPGYDRAKAIIYFINSIARIINSDPAVKDLMRVVFVHNYDCSYAEKIIPAAEISEQISPAGTEASGTSNMKLMMNGAVTLGTMDGANIEIVEKAGRENNYIFGATVEEINRIRADYDPNMYYRQNASLRRAMDWLTDGHVADPAGALKELHDALLKGATWHQPDHYFICLDFAPYLEAKLQANRDYRDRLAFARKCLLNAANAGDFSSDRTIREYAREIWRTE